MKGQIPAVVVTPAFFPFSFHTAEKKVLFDQPFLNLTVT